MEAPSGFEPLNEGFADPSLNHLGTAPREGGLYPWVPGSKGPVQGCEFR